MENTVYYILLVDGSCYKIVAKSIAAAVDTLSHLQYQDDLDTAWYDVNMIEWKGQCDNAEFVEGVNDTADSHRYLQVYDRSMISETYRFHIDTDYRLSEYVTLTRKITNNEI